MKYLDFRSDTITRPSPEMRRAIAEAEVGDDVFRDDPTVMRLEATVSELFSKEAAIFVPSGTMGNQAALKTLSEPGWEILCERDCHIVNYETAGPAIHSSLLVNMIDTEYGVMTAEQIENSVREPNIHSPITKIVAIENTHNRHGGTIYPLDEILKIREVADRHGLLMHLDGARIWNAHAATGIPLADWVKPFDSVSVCMSKGLGAPVGSMILGSKDFIEKALRTRKLFGGAMRQTGILAAAALYAIKNNIGRLTEDHANARVLAEGLGRVDGFTVDMKRVQTNIILVDIAGTWKTPAEILNAMKEKGVLAVPFGRSRLRFVTHLDVTREDCEKAVEIISDIKF
ncbi:MAG TPA: aminotransferase class I/II-fold pyridoxal phosphate-dependent enzyme [candidate division Zixibacteria bacterium]|nr:aminotransferase class I/II-fold pyridoxal phosphate-dependent enzyme [candidate division Zixibacteria bacterium]